MYLNVVMQENNRNNITEITIISKNLKNSLFSGFLQGPCIILKLGRKIV